MYQVKIKDFAAVHGGEGGISSVASRLWETLGFPTFRHGKTVIFPTPFLFESPLTEKSWQSIPTFFWRCFLNEVRTFFDENPEN